MQLHDKTQEVTALNNQQRSILEDLKAEKALSETHQTALMAIRNEVAQLHREGDYLRYVGGYKVVHGMTYQEKNGWKRSK